MNQIKRLIHKPFWMTLEAFLCGYARIRTIIGWHWQGCLAKMRGYSAAPFPRQRA
jgi:hypothetical protein